MNLQLIRNATCKMTYGGYTILTDPYFAGKLTRPSFRGISKNPTVDLPMSIDEILSDVDMVMVSHMHSDHFDDDAQRALKKDIPILCQKEDKHDIQALGFGDVTAVKDVATWRGITISHVDGRHGTGDVLDDMGIVSGFMFKACGEPSVYWCGDTILSDEIRTFLAEQKPDIILVHASGAVWGDDVKIVMDETDVIKVAKLLPNSKVVAIHMEALDHATVTREALKKFAVQHGVDDKQLLIPNDGETIVF
jgi:L-ascorbate metabolism protein UlaG (beta-lactamase superfamily)